MTYLPDTLIPVLNDPKSYFWATNSILRNSLTAVLAKEGYKAFQYQPLSFDNKDWPEEPNFHRYRKFHFFYKTFPGRVYRDLFWNLGNSVMSSFFQKSRIRFIKERNNKKHRLLNYTIKKVKATTSLRSGPKFVYGHFMIPHDPYIYDSTGNLLPPEHTIITGNKELLKSYQRQLYYAGSILKELVDHIQLNNRKNTVIIVEGDHGFRYYTNQGQEYMYQNMNAIYFPDKDYRMLYDSLSPVNTFRIILNKYFGTNYPMLTDKSIYVPEQNPNQVVR